MGTWETMVPNYGVSNTASGNPMMATPGSGISMMSVLASNTVVPNPVGMGCMFPAGSGSGWMHSNSLMTADGNPHKMFHDPVLKNVFSNPGGYLSSLSEPLGTMLQCQQDVGCMSMGSTDRIVPTIGVQGGRSQMIPIPGIGGSQSVWINTAPQQFTGGEICQVCCNMSGKTCGIMGGINLLPRNSSYGSINYGIQLEGNNRHFMNGTTTLSNSGDYLNASEHSNLQVSSHQNVTQEHQRHLMQSAKVNQMASLADDSYAMNTADLTGSGNFYGLASSGALLTTASLCGQSLGSLSRKLIPVPGLPTEQHQQKQHSQQGQQLSVERRGELQNQPALTVFGKNQEDAETHQNGASKKELPEQKQLPREEWLFTVNDPLLKQSEAWNDNSLYTQQVNPEQSEKLHKLQVLSSQHQQKTQTNNDYNNLSAQVKPEVSLHGERDLQSQKKLQLVKQFSSFIEQSQPPQQERPQVDQDITQQHQKSQQFLGNDIASTTMSQTRCGTAGDTMGSVQPSISAAKQKMQIVRIKKLLLYFYHVRKCKAPECQYQTGAYIRKYKLWEHITTCHDRQCIYPYCRASLNLVRHHRRCSDKCCPVCGPVRQLTMKHLAKKHTRSSKHGEDEFVNAVPNFSNFKSSIGTNINFLENHRTSVLDTQDEQPPLKRRKVEPASPSCSQQEVRSKLGSTRIPSEMQGLTQMQTLPSGHEAGMLQCDALKSILVASTRDRTQDKPPPIIWSKIRPASSSCDQQEVESTMVSMKSSSEMEVLTQIQTQLCQPSKHDLSMMKNDVLKTVRVKPALLRVEQSVRSQQGPRQKNCILNNETFRNPHAEHGAEEFVNAVPNSSNLKSSIGTNVNLLQNYRTSQSSKHGADEFVNAVPNSSNFKSSIGTNINLLENYKTSVLDTQDEQPPMKRRKVEPVSPSHSQQEVRSKLVSTRIPSEMQGLTQMQTLSSGHESGILKCDTLKSIQVASMRDRTQDKPPPILWGKIGPASSTCGQQEVESEMEVLTQIQTQLCQPSKHDLSMMKNDVLKTIRVKPALLRVEQSVRSQQGPRQKNCILNNETFRTPHAEHGQIQEKLNKLYLATSLSANVPKQVEQETMQSKQEPIMDVSPTDNSTLGNFAKPMNPMVKGISLMELFTLEQISKHIIGLQKWADKVDTHQSMECEMSDEACQLCKLEKLTFVPPPVYCSLCPSHIKTNAPCYRVAADASRHCICIPCYNKIRCDTVKIDGKAYAKSELVKEKNEEDGTEEAWVFCDNCHKWQHNICALFNGKRNEVDQAEYLCPNCYTEQIKRGVRKPLPQSAILGAKDLPTTHLSDHIERRLCRRLEQERNERAKALGKSFEEVLGVDALVVRVVSSVDKILKVKQQFVENLQHEDYPTEFPYKSKVLLLFQEIEGVEVCLFGMYVQEYGSECSHPNQRRIYLSYLDSVKYFRPDVKTATGEALRTFVFHEILIGYLEYSKRRGFASCYIWVCPPSDRDDYILYRHPEIQKTPNANKLREWYHMMLRKASKEDVVLDVTNLYDFFFVSSGERKAKVTAARLPYFDGDCWPGAAEKVIMQFQQEAKNERKRQKTKKYTTRTSSNAAAHALFASDSSKDSLLMKKYRDTIRWSKENFIMVHMQHACTHCCLFVVSGKRWVCKQCKNFQLCDKCYESEQKLEQKQKHPIKSMEKHTLFPIKVTDVPADTKDKDDIMECEFFDTRHTFLSLCQENNYQYDTLRRAKHSSMMVLYHLHNQTAPAHPFVADQDAQNPEACEHGV